MFSKLRLRWTYWLYRTAQKRQTRAKRHKDPSFRTLRHIIFVETYLTPPWPGPVLCLGPRNGIELERLRDAGCADVTGLDLLSTSPDIQRGDMHAMPYQAGRFGMIWASHVLEHALEPQKVFNEIVRVLKPGGYLFAAYPTNFIPTWHDRFNYGLPDNLLTYMPAARLITSRLTVAGESQEWAALYRMFRPAGTRYSG